MADPLPGSLPTSSASRTAGWPSTGTCSRTRRRRPNRSAACRCSVTGSPADLLDCLGSTKELSDMTLEDTKRILVGEWVSVTPEVRPSATRNPDATLKPFYLSREFKYLGDDRFELTISNWADPYGKVAVARIDLRGHIEWVGEHPIARGVDTERNRSTNLQGPLGRKR